VKVISGRLFFAGQLSTPCGLLDVCWFSLKWKQGAIR
jgi:hypothetical protein